MFEDQAPPLGVPGGPAVGDDSHAVLGSDMTELTGSVKTRDPFGFFYLYFLIDILPPHISWVSVIF